MKAQRGLTRLDGVPDRSQARPGMAYFEGTGPWDKSCFHCVHRSRATDRCAVYAKLAGQRGPAVKPEWRACKYFEEGKP